MFTVTVNHRRPRTQSSEDTTGSPRKFAFPQRSSPDVHRVGGGAKTNISLLEELSADQQEKKQRKTVERERRGPKKKRNFSVANMCLNIQKAFLTRLFTSPHIHTPAPTQGEEKLIVILKITAACVVMDTLPSAPQG